jgi:hypothetical protein
MEAISRQNFYTPRQTDASRKCCGLPRLVCGVCRQNKSAPMRRLLMACQVCIPMFHSESKVTGQLSAGWKMHFLATEVQGRQLAV